jgi:hypothetical protein
VKRTREIKLRMVGKKGEGKFERNKENNKKE